MDIELFKRLVRGNYILYYNQKLVVTNKFKREFAVIPSIDVTKGEVAVASSKAVAVVPKVADSQMVSLLSRFIMDCKIPAKSNTPEPYSLNKFNSAAEKILAIALKKGIEYDVLVQATARYYRKETYPNHIGNYFIKGVWRGEYEAMLHAKADGKVSEHIADAPKTSRWER